MNGSSFYSDRDPFASRRPRLPKVIKVAVLVTERTRSKDLSMVLDAAFEHDPEILQFVVDGWPEDAELSETALWRALVDDATDRLTEGPSA